MARPCKIKNEAAFTKMWLNPDCVPKAIAAHFRVSTQVVYKTRRRLNLAAPCEIKRNSVIPNLNAMQEMWEQGAKAQEIADRFERSPSYIYSLVKGYKWSRRSGKGKSRVGYVQPQMSHSKPIKDAQRAPRTPKQARICRSFTLSRLSEVQIEALAKTKGAYAALDALADDWGKPRSFVVQCWNEYNAAAL